MKLWPFQRKNQSALAPAGGSSWWSVIRESFTGAWQKNIEVHRDTVSAYWAVFACVTLIAGDIAKMPVRVMERGEGGIFRPTLARPVLRKPNSYQTRLEFFTCLVFSLLLRGNAYILKQRDDRGFVVALYVLDPDRVMPMVATDGSIYYALSPDNLSGMDGQSVTVPASEIIHNRINTLHHPLIGLSPLYACGVAAAQGLAIQNNSANFFTNGSMPGGIIMVPGRLDPEKAAELKRRWNESYSGNKRGQTAVLAEGMEYKPMTLTAADSQLIEQLKMTAEMVCACFHVPGYKIGVGQMPTVNNTAVLNQQYYDQCLHVLIEGIEQRLDEGLELEFPFEVWFDVKELLRMDPEARYKSHNEAIKGGWLAPNEARREEDMPDVDGGETPYMQQQNYSLAALARRDEMAMQPPAPTPPPAEQMEEQQRSAFFRRSLETLKQELAA